MSLDRYSRRDHGESVTDDSPWLGHGLSRLKDGRVMCCICFEYRTKDDLAKDADGQTWDACKGRCAADAGLVEVPD